MVSSARPPRSMVLIACMASGQGGTCGCRPARTASCSDLGSRARCSSMRSQTDFGAAADPARLKLRAHQEVGVHGSRPRVRCPAPPRWPILAVISQGQSGFPGGRAADLEDHLRARSRGALSARAVLAASESVVEGLHTPGMCSCEKTSRRSLVLGQAQDQHPAGPGEPGQKRRQVAQGAGADDGHGAPQQGAGLEHRVVGDGNGLREGGQKRRVALRAARMQPEAGMTAWRAMTPS